MEEEPNVATEEEEEGDNDGFLVPHGYLSEDEGNLLSDEEMVSTVTMVTVAMVTTGW